MADFNGSSGDDIFTGGGDPDTAYGNGGNDMLSGAGGNDKLYGGAGADTLDGGANDDILISFDASNVFYAYSGMVSLDVGIEHDVLVGGDGDDILAAGFGDDVSGGTGYNKLFINFLGATAGVHADFRLQQSGGSIVIGGGTISGITQTSDIQGSNYDDTIYSIGSYYGFSTLHGNGGNDQLFADYYTHSMYGDEGNDVVDGRGSQYLSRVEGGAGDDTLYTHTNTFAAAYGGDGNDTIYSHGATYGGTGNDLIILQASYYGGQVLGEAGDDEIRASSNGHLIAGGAGADILTGSSGYDQLYSADLVANSSSPADDMGLEHDQLSGGGGDDILAIGYGDDADGGAATDTLRLSLGGLASGIVFDTAGIVTGQPFVLGGGTIQNIETLVYLRGSNFADTLTLATQGQLLIVDAGDGDDVVISSNSSVSVLGGNGNDLFISGAAGDILDGGAAIDTVDYRNAAAGVTVTLALVAGQTGSGPGGDQLKNIENINGSALGDTLNGSDGANILEGLGGNDALNGNGGDDKLVGGFGDDMMSGGLGNDQFLVHDAGDQVFESANQGIDTVLTSVTFTLGAGQHVERIELIGDPMAALGLTGNELANMLVGNDADNALNGGGGNDTLYGGAGVDAMTGGTGDDSYFVDSAGDQVFEAAGGGNDRIYTRVDYTLYAGQSVEILSTDWNAGTAAINLGGNELDNVIYGNAGNNILYGQGGNDWLEGLGGDDSYFVDSAGDYVREAGGAGFDRIYAGGDYTLYAGQHVEVLSTDWNAGTAAIALGGNELNNIIYGNAGNNILYGKGGNDFIGGLGGDDSYYIDSAGDYVQEFAGGGADRIFAGGDYTLYAGQSVEILSTDHNAATAAIALGGNELDNVIYGNDGANILYGKEGNDTLMGLGGNDSFWFNTTLGATNVDAIYGFVSGADKLVLFQSAFAGLSSGSLAASAFVTGSAAGDADDRIVYNSATGALLYDADGSGAGAAVQFATLNGAPALAAGDFIVF